MFLFCEHISVPRCICRGHRAICGSQFSPYTQWVQKLNFGLAKESLSSELLLALDDFSLILKYSCPYLPWCLNIFIFIFVCMSILSACSHAYHLCAVPMEARHGHWNPCVHVCMCAHGGQTKALEPMCTCVPMEARQVHWNPWSRSFSWQWGIM